MVSSSCRRQIAGHDRVSQGVKKEESNRGGGSDGEEMMKGSWRVAHLCMHLLKVES